MGLEMIKFFLVTLLFAVSINFAQSDTLTSKSDTTSEKNLQENSLKMDKEFKPLSLTYLKMSTPLNSLTFNPDAMFYSQTFVYPGQFNAPNKLPNISDFLKPLRPRIDPTKQTVETILKYVGTAAAFGVAAAHVNKYWKEYKRDLGLD